MRHFGDFLQYIRFVKHYSPHTVLAYERDLEQFFLFCGYGSDADESEVNPAAVRSWLVDLLEHGHTPRTANRKISTLKTYFRFLNKEGLVTGNPVSRVITPRIGKKLPEFVREQQMDTLLDEVAFEEGVAGLRNRLMIGMFYQTGMRLSELTGVKCSDLELGQRTVRVLGKRRKERIIPLDGAFCEELSMYLQVRSETFGAEAEPWLFLTRKGKKLYPKLVYRVVRHFLSLVTTADKKSPHVLRHTFATSMLNRGADLNAIKELLGHASLAATEVYTHNTFEKLKSVYKQAHPRA